MTKAIIYRDNHNQQEQSPTFTQINTLNPLTIFINKLIPENVFFGLFLTILKFVSFSINSKKILQKTNVTKITDLKTTDIEISNQLANNTHHWNMVWAGLSGIVTGIFFFFVLIDVPLITFLSLHVIAKIGMYYGYDCNSQEEENFILSIFLSTNSMKGKAFSVISLQEIKTILKVQSWKKIAESATSSQFSKEYAIIAIRSFAKKLSINLTKRKFINIIPIIGAVIGCFMNIWHINDIALTARRLYRERRLSENIQY